MADNVIRCPNCGGDVDIVPSQGVVKCPYCNSDIVNTFFDTKKNDMVTYLTAAKSSLEKRDIEGCSRNLDRASIIESDCSDIWFMKAALYSADDELCQINKDRAMEASISFGIFTETDMELYRTVNTKAKTNIIRLIFLSIAAFIIVIGGSLSLGLGLGLGTPIPLYVTILLLVFLLIAYVIVILVRKK